MIGALLLATSLALGGTPVPVEPGEVERGTATWYGEPSSGACYGGRLRTCTPYVARTRFGVPLTQTFYAATGQFYPYSHRAYSALVCGTRACVVVQVRDHCTGCRANPKRRLIDLAPAVFLAACGPLGRGVCPVTVVHGVTGLGLGTVVAYEDRGRSAASPGETDARNHAVPCYRPTVGGPYVILR